MKRVHEQAFRGSKAGVGAVPCRCAAQNTGTVPLSAWIVPVNAASGGDRETGSTFALRHPNLPDWSPHGPVTDVTGTPCHTYLGPRPAGRVPSGGF